MKASSFITRNSKILNGVPIIAGTRIPVSRIFYLIIHGYTTKEIQKEFPQLSLEQVNGVIMAIAKELEKRRFFL